MSGTYWSLEECAWVACDGQAEVCTDPLGEVTDVVELPGQREAVPVPVEA